MTTVACERKSVCGHCEAGVVPAGVTSGYLDWSICPACAALDRLSGASTVWLEMKYSVSSILSSRQLAAFIGFAAGCAIGFFASGRMWP